MTLRPCLLIFGTWFFLLTGCSDLKEDHPQAVTERCEVCHMSLPPHDSGTGDEIHYFHSFENELLRNVDTVNMRKVVPYDHLKCERCHLNYDTITGWTQDSLHRNDRLDLDSTALQCHLCHDYRDCNNCHQSPPNDMGNPLSQRVHAIHVTRNKYACDSCHQGYDPENRKLPITYTGKGPATIHNNGDTNVVFGIKKHTMYPPIYDLAGHKCSNIYCHGADRKGGKLTVAVTDQIKQDSTRCDFCHDTDSLRVSGHHLLEGHLTLFPECLNCHEGYDLTRFIVNDSTHVNGVLNRIPCIKCNGCHAPDIHECVEP